MLHIMQRIGFSLSLKSISMMNNISFDNLYLKEILLLYLGLCASFNGYSQLVLNNMLDK